MANAREHDPFSPQRGDDAPVFASLTIADEEHEIVIVDADPEPVTPEPAPTRRRGRRGKVVAVDDANASDAGALLAKLNAMRESAE